jgi:O-antigen ligase
MHLNIATLALAGVLGLVFLWWAMKSTETWLIVAILSHLILFLHKRGADTSVFQAVAYSLLFFPGLFWWFAKRVMGSKRILHHWAEFALVAFLGLAFVSIGWAWLYGSSSVKGLREFALFIPYLMYFPLRDYVAENNEKYILGALLFVCMTVAAFDIVEYRLSMAVAHYLWQVVGKRENLGEPLMVGSIIILFGFIAANKYNRVLVITSIAVSSIALALTFSRGYWGTAVFGLFLLVFVLKGAPRRRVLTLSFLSVMAVVVVAMIVFPRLFEDLIEGLGMRLAGSGLKDLSLQSRLAESAVILQHFTLSPVIGYGMGAEFSFFNPITYGTLTTWYVHNGYLFLLYKFGAIGAFLYLSFYGYILVRTARHAAHVVDEKIKTLMWSLFCVMSSMLVVNLTSPQFYDRVAILVFVTISGISAGIIKRDELAARANEGGTRFDR